MIGQVVNRDIGEVFCDFIGDAAVEFLAQGLSKLAQDSRCRDEDELIESFRVAALADVLDDRSDELIFFTLFGADSRLHGVASLR